MFAFHESEPESCANSAAMTLVPDLCSAHTAYAVFAVMVPMNHCNMLTTYVHIYIYIHVIYWLRLLPVAVCRSFMQTGRHICTGLRCAMDPEKAWKLEPLTRRLYGASVPYVSHCD